MDKLPRLRRKPKPPAIETSVERTSSDIDESAVVPADTASGAAAPKTSSMTKPLMKHSSLRNLKLRVTAKRARAESPAARPWSSPMVAIFNQDGVAPRSATEGSLSANGHGRSLPVMPSFLNISAQGMDSRPLCPFFLPLLFTFFYLFFFIFLCAETPPRHKRPATY